MNYWDEKCHVVSSEAIQWMLIYERKGCAMEVYFQHFHCLGAGERACLKQHPWVKGENHAWLPQREAKARLQGCGFSVPGVRWQGPYLVCMFGKCLRAGHHARSPFIQLAQLLSSLIKGNACTSQVPDDSSSCSSHAFNSTWSRDVLGKAARGFSCRGLTNCNRERDKQAGMSSWPWLCQRFSSLSCSLAVGMPFDVQLACMEDVALRAGTATVQSLPPSSVALKKLPRWRNHGKSTEDPSGSLRCHLYFFINELNLMYHSVPR